MDANNNKQLSGFYFSRWVACLPLFVMILPSVVLSLNGVLSTGIMIAGGVVGLMVGSLLARDKKEYWEVVTRSFGDPTGLLIFALFLMVGIYGELLGAAELPQALIWLSEHMHVGPAGFALFVYVVCSVLGTAMGTSVGIVIILTPVLYPTAVALGVHPALAAGAILSGAATGDHFAPVSDTTIISSSTQRYKTSERSADIGEVVRARLIYAVPAFILSCLLYLVIGGISAGSITESGGVLLNNADPLGLIMVVPMLAVIITAIAGRSVFEALTWGTLAGFILGIASGLIDWEQIFYVNEGGPAGILVDGALQNLDTVVMIILMMGAYGVMRTYGLLDTIVMSLKNSVGKTPRSTELTMFGVGWLMNFLLVGLVARITVVAGPIFNELGRVQNIHPVRRANILDAVANSFSFVVPWHVWPLFMIMTISPLVETYPFLEVPAPTDFLLSTFYPLIIWCVMLIAILTGYGRKFENGP